MLKLQQNVQLIPGLNPGPFTLQGTNTYLIGIGKHRVLIDTGEGLPAYGKLLKESLNTLDCSIDIVLITHHHRDHTGGLRDILQLNPNVRIFKNLKCELGDDTQLQEEFHFKYEGLNNGQIFEGEGYKIESIEMPGHCIDHYSFLLDDHTWFSGDCLLGGSSSLINDLIPYLHGLNCMLQKDIKSLYPGHGCQYTEDCNQVIAKQIQHRLLREQQIIQALQQQKNTVDSIQQCVYPDLNNEMLMMAARNNIEVHLRKLCSENRVLNENNQYYII